MTRKHVRNYEHFIKSSDGLELTRRKFLEFLGITAAAASLPGFANLPQTEAKENTPQQQFSGSDLSGWTTVLGDGLYHQPDEPPPDISDIETVHFGNYSELRANIHSRDIMAHNITFYRIDNDQAFDFIHVCGYKFRLPYMPSTNNTEFNPQTIEGGLVIWDGRETRLDYHVTFQWRLNPWEPEYKTIAIWSNESPAGAWKIIGALEPDTEWHQLEIAMDFKYRSARLSIDDAYFPVYIAGTTKPSYWGPEISARLMAEIISIYPGTGGHGFMHKAQFKDWYWKWDTHDSCSTFFPIVLNKD